MSTDPAHLRPIDIARRISAFERGEAPGAGVDAALPAHAAVIGITGVPGAGKSTLVDALVGLYRSDHPRVAVIAVDPSSPVTGGAVLGDRVRMNRHATDPGVFIRSMGSRGRRDGIGPAVQDSSRLLCAAGYDPVLIETVGVGQIELGVVECCDVRVLVLAPAWGDYIQAAKAGLIEMVDIVVINKSDLPGAASLLQELAEAVRRRDGRREVQVVAATASHGEVGAAEVRKAIDACAAHLRQGELRARRVEAMTSELASRLGAAFSAGPLKRVIEDGTLERWARAVCDGEVAATRAAEDLFREALRRQV